MEESTPRTLREAQQEVDAFIRSFAQGYFPELANLARLTEEVGELASILLRSKGPLKPKPGDAIDAAALRDEMGDILFTLICLANQSSIDLEEALRTVIQKYKTRDRNRHDGAAPPSN